MSRVEMPEETVMSIVSIGKQIKTPLLCSGLVPPKVLLENMLRVGATAAQVQQCEGESLKKLWNKSAVTPRNAPQTTSHHVCKAWPPCGVFLAHEVTHKLQSNLAAHCPSFYRRRFSSSAGGRVNSKIAIEGSGTAEASNGELVYPQLAARIDASLGPTKPSWSKSPWSHVAVGPEPQYVANCTPSF